MGRADLSDPIFLPDAEIAKRVSMTPGEWEAAAVVLERSGLPRPDHPHGHPMTSPSTHTGERGGASLLRGFQQAAAWARSTRAKAPTAEDLAFLGLLREDRSATRRDLGPANSARQRCRRSGWAECVGKNPGVHKSGWVLTEAGAKARAAGIEVREVAP